MDTTDLIKEAKHGSLAAQKCLYDLFAPRLLMVCRRYVKSAEDAEELLLDGYYRFFKNLAAFELNGESALFQYLKKIMINECLMFLRKKKTFQIVPETMAEDIPLQEEAINRLSAAEIFKLIIQLPVGYRTVFNLFVIEGWDHREIASYLKISESTSKSQLSRAKVMLQKMLLLKDEDYAKRKQQ